MAYDLATDIIIIIIDGEFIYYTNPTSADVKSNIIINLAPIASSITSGIANPSSLLLNNGTLYVSDATNGKIYISNILVSSINSELIASGLNQPQSMALFNNERKEITINKLNILYEEKLYIETLKISKEYVNGFKYYIVENDELVQSINSKNYTFATFLMNQLALKYLSIIKN